MAHVAVLGAGSWGTALAQVLALNGHDAYLWGRNTTQMDEIRRTRENKKYLPEVTLHPDLEIGSDFPDLLSFDYIIVSVPAQSQRQLIESHREAFISSNSLLINVAKGIETSTQKCIHEIYEQLIPDVDKRFVVLSGPSHAEEFGKNMPTALVAASISQNAAVAVQNLFMNENVRVYTSHDVVGVELGGALKNIIALAVGMTVGLGYGDNARAALMTRGLAEITRLGVAMGAEPYTFLGLTGMGDLIVTCTSMHSRNYRAGLMLGQGKNLQYVLDHMGMVVEGVATSRAAHAVAESKNIEMPILQQMYHVLFTDGDVREAARILMTRQKKPEPEKY